MNSNPWMGALMALSLISGCAQNHSARPAEPTHVSPQAAKIERERPALPAPKPEPLLKVVPSVGECAPPALKGETFGSCCNGKTCNGQCVELEDGSTGCACFDVPGGCAEGLVCCKVRRACVPEDECGVP